MIGRADLYTTSRPFKTIVVGDDKIVSVNATSDRSASVTALMVGTTNVIFVDDGGTRIAEYEVEVTPPRPPPAQRQQQPPNVRIYNSAEGYRSFLCGPTFCDQK
jgi:Flp pilus assembly secretin CpaC